MRIIAHVDMDAFYAAVEERYHPELRGRPVVVGADPKGGKGRGVVTAASYAARKYGIRSALPISRAWRLAEAARKRGEPEAVFVRGDRSLYREVSGRIMAIVAEGADAFEEASIDEAYIDLSSLGGMEEGEAHARALKGAILEREGLTCSIGIGPKTEAVLQAKGLRTVAELRGVEFAQLREWFGKAGEELYQKVRGNSDDPVSNEWERKSVGEQETFEEDTLDSAFIQGRGVELASEVFRRFVAEGFQTFRTVTVTVRFTGFVTVSRSRTGQAPAAAMEQLQAEVRQLLEPFFDARENPKGKKIRLIGVRVEKLLRAP